MSVSLGKCSKIWQIIRLQQMLRRWRHKAAASRHRMTDVPSDVPAGHVAVSVGTSGRRFIVPATHLNHPVFKKLLLRAEEEYGFTNRWGPLAIPCDEFLFEHILRYLTRPDSVSNRFDELQRCLHVGVGEPLIHRSCKSPFADVISR